MEQDFIDWAQCGVAEVVRGRVGGAPVLRSTRLPIEAILNNFDDGLDPEQVALIFEVSVADVQSVLAFREQQVAGSSRS